MKKIASKEFTNKLIQFRKELGENSPDSWTWSERTILTAFQLWFNDSRDVDAWEEAKLQEQEHRKQQQEERGEGWKSGD